MDEFMVVEVVVPPGLTAGDTFSASFDGESFDVEVPQGTAAEDLVPFTVPRAPKRAYVMEEWLFNESGQLVGRAYGRADTVDGKYVVTSCVPGDQRHAEHVQTTSGSVYRLGLKAAIVEDWVITDASVVHGRIFGKPGIDEGGIFNSSTLSVREAGYVVTESGSVYALAARRRL